MIRLNKPVKLLEWGEGTNTMNQRWEEIAEGKILSAKQANQNTTVIVEVKGPVNKKNQQNDWVKMSQLNEGIAPLAVRWGKITPRWGEVAMGKLKKVTAEQNKSLVEIEISTATKAGLAYE